MKLTPIFAFLGALRFDRAFGRITDNRRADEDQFHVLIGLKQERTTLFNRTAPILSRLKRVRARFRRISAVSAVVTRSELEELRNDPDVSYVEEDPEVFPDAEAVLYGLEMVQAVPTIIPSRSSSLT